MHSVYHLRANIQPCMFSRQIEVVKLLSNTNTWHYIDFCLLFACSVLIRPSPPSSNSTAIKNYGSRKFRGEASVLERTRELPASTVVCSSLRRAVTSAFICLCLCGSSGKGYLLAPNASQICKAILFNDGLLRLYIFCLQQTLW